MFVDWRWVYTWGAGRWTRITDVKQASRTAMLDCAPLAPTWVPGLWGGYYDAHNGIENFAFVDGHAGAFQAQPIVDWWKARGGPSGSHAYAYTYPPGVTPGEAQWWTVPWYPDLYPYFYGAGPLP